MSHTHRTASPFDRSGTMERIRNTTVCPHESESPVADQRVHLAYYGNRCLSVCFPSADDSGDLEWHAKQLTAVVAALVRAVSVVIEAQGDSDPPDWASNVTAGVELVAGMQQALVDEVRERAKRGTPA